ncbi:MAG TPA: polyribonucleotide nucleotidyltransferase [Candidatus Paceibacterota bacterium]
MTKKEFSMQLGGRILTATFSDLADQTNGSVMIRMGDTIVLVTAVMGKTDKAGIDYFPLTVDYEEKFYAAGKIMGSRFIKRENRPSDEAILSGRIVDRTIRPLFNQDMRREVQVVATVLSIDDTNDPDTLAVIGASLALGTSDIPWEGPVSAVRVAVTEGEKPFDLLVCGRNGNVNMIECEAKEIPESIIEESLNKASEEIEKIQTWQKQIISEISRIKTDVPTNAVTREHVQAVRENVWDELRTALFNNAFTKADTSNVASKWAQVFITKFPEQAGNAELSAKIFDTATDELVHEEAIVNDRRPDGRKFDEIRPLFTQAGGLSPIVHGVGIFYRGATHVLSVLTLGGPGDAQVIEGMEVSQKKRFMHHYNFPPFSTGEVGRMGGSNRRSIGHGALAEKALRGTLPPVETFPYTIRLVSESTASNGSTSMASVCASTLAMMDGGVPITRPTAGIAMGLMMSTEVKLPESSGSLTSVPYKILTDIQGAEDHFGDMDFKVAGTNEGVCALQLDIKVGGIPIKILIEALEQARKARMQILEKIKEAIPEFRIELSPNAPKIISLKIAEEEIGKVIGSGGKTINKIIDETGADVNIEDDGTVFITGKLGTAERAREMVLELVTPLNPGQKFEGEVTKLLDFGAVVKIGHFNEGLVHISEIAPFRLDRIDQAVVIGEKVQVMVLPDDERRPGKLRLSIKSADPDFAKRKNLVASTNPAPSFTPRRDDHRGPPHRDFRR